jgi:hypothetical protein
MWENKSVPFFALFCVFGVGYFWDKAAESGFKCNFMNLSGTTYASGYIEDKKLTGSLWWGRGNVSMTEQ